MRKKKPHVASLDEVRISREGDDAIIEFIDTAIATTHLQLGLEVQEMTDDEILARFNDVLRAQQRLASQYVHVAVEVPPGSPQIRYHPDADQWAARGDVLCGIVDDDDDGAVIWIDDQPLTMRQFGRLLESYAGWGMRITFVPDDEVEQLPRIEVRELDEC